jgi:pyruvate/2-oxoglutarate dehydrogenase complex dihydrolipoamide acyltransferase (E2) component
MPNAPHVGEFEVVPFRPERNATLDTLRWAKKRLTASGFAEIDVTVARRAIRAYRQATGRELSFTAWVVSCIARAAVDHPRVHALRRGKRELVLFRGADVAVVIERDIGAGDAHESLPMPYVVRDAHAKDIRTVHEELRRAQMRFMATGAVALDPGFSVRLLSAFVRLPAWLRDLVYWRWLFRSPVRIKRTMGTIVVTSAGMAAPGVRTWGSPLSIHPLAVGIGGIAHRESSAGDAEVLTLSLVFDHAVTDGAPVGRFVHQLSRLMSGAWGLAELGSGPDATPRVSPSPPAA